MKLVICKTNLKISILLLLILSIQILSFSDKHTQMQRLKNPNRFISESSEEKEKTKFVSTTIGEKIRFKSTTNEGTDDTNDILTNSVITDKKKEGPSAEDHEIEVHPQAATAKSEFSWGFLFWSFMNFGASNALSGHSGYWLSERSAKNDYWDVIFEKPTKIDSVEIDWRLPPKRLKIFHKLDGGKF